MKYKELDAQELPAFLDHKPYDTKVFDVVLGAREAVNYRIRVKAKDRAEAVRLVQKMAREMNAASPKGLYVSNPPFGEMIFHCLTFNPDLISSMDAYPVEEGS